MGFLMFVVGIPALMWLVSGRPFPWAPWMDGGVDLVQDTVDLVQGTSQGTVDLVQGTADLVQGTSQDTVDLVQGPANTASIPTIIRSVIAIALAIAGLALSIWSIIHMRKVGEGNPMDAYGHEIAPRTKHLMTDGPYKFSRNPMLLGVYIYDAGVLLWLLSWWPLAIAAIEVILLTLQVRSEEKRLEKDFGEEYIKYKQQVRRYL